MRVTFMAPMFALLSVPANSQEPPDYLAFQEQVDRFAFAVVSARSCEHFGYRSDEQELRDKGRQLIGEAVLAGMPAGNANLIVTGALNSEGEREADRAKEMEARKSDPAALDQFLDYWERRCDTLGSDPAYAPYFRR